MTLRTLYHLSLLVLFLLPNRMAWAQVSEGPNGTMRSRSVLDPELHPPMTAGYARQRGLEVEARQRELKVKVRPKRYGLKLGLSIASIGAGVLTIMIGMLNMPFHGSGDPRGPGIAMAAGVAPVLLGAGCLAYLRLRVVRSRRPHRAQFQRLREERVYWDRMYRESLERDAEAPNEAPRASLGLGPGGLMLDVRL